MAEQRPVAFPRRGDVYVVQFDPTIGSEIGKPRPALILQNDIGNQYSPLTIVAAITSKTDDRRYPVQALVMAPEGGLENDSIIQLDQIRTVDKRRLVQRLGSLRPETMIRVERAVMISLGMIRL